MADYYPLIARAVAGLEKNTGDARRAIYERARAALLAQLRGVTPELNETDVTRERLALEEAVRKVEAESVRRSRPEPRPDSTSKVRPPEMPRWDAPPAAPAPAEEPPDAAARRGGSPPPRPDNLRRPPARPRVQDEPPPVPKGPLGEHRYDDQGFERPMPDTSPALAPAGLQRPPLRPRPSGERQSLLDSVNSFRSVVSDAEGLGEASARSAKSVRRTYVESPAMARDLGRVAARGIDPNDSDELLEDAAIPEMLEPTLGMDEARALPNRARLPQFFRDDERRLEPPRARSYRDLIKVAAALAMVAGMGGVLAWQAPNLAALYHSLRAPPTMEVAGSESSAPASRTKIVDRYEPGAASQPQKNAALTPDASEGPAVAQRVVLYEEDPDDPQGKRFVGSAIWRTETVSRAPGQPPELAVRADVEIPERQLAMTWSLRRNTDPTLPASHTVEIMFKLPNDFASGGVLNVPGILMKQAEQARGAPLAGLAVKVTNGFFLIGLSSVEADKQRNIALLKDRSWFDIPVVYNNNRRAILAIEKGAPGERAFAEAFAAWQE